jgi:hypothetical protein
MLVRKRHHLVRTESLAGFKSVESQAGPEGLESVSANERTQATALAIDKSIIFNIKGV